MQPGRHDTRRHHRDADARPHGLVGERLGEGQHEGLRRRVGRLIGNRHIAHHRGHVDDAAASALDHAGQKTEGEVDERAHVEVDHALRGLEVLVLEEAG